MTNPTLPCTSLFEVLLSLYVLGFVEMRLRVRDATVLEYGTPITCTGSTEDYKYWMLIAHCVSVNQRHRRGGP